MNVDELERQASEERRRRVEATDMMVLAICSAPPGRTKGEVRSAILEIVERGDPIYELGYLETLDELLEVLSSQGRMSRNGEYSHSTQPGLEWVQNPKRIEWLRDFVGSVTADRILAYLPRL